MPAPRKYDQETRDRAVRMYRDLRREFPAESALQARQRVGGLLDMPRPSSPPTSGHAGPRPPSRPLNAPWTARSYASSPATTSSPSPAASRCPSAGSSCRPAPLMSTVAPFDSPPPISPTAQSGAFSSTWCSASPAPTPSSGCDSRSTSTTPTAGRFPKGSAVPGWRCPPGGFACAGRQRRARPLAEPAHGGRRPP